MLVNVPRLVTAYYTDVPDPSLPEQRVCFGTSGHRGSAFERSFNEWHVLAISQAICLYRSQQKINGPLFLGMDTHALSMPALAGALEVLGANGVEIMLAEYTEQHYLPAASAYRERAADKGAVGRQVVDWRQALEQKWTALRFGEMKVETKDEQHVYEVQVYLNDLDPKAVRVELYADGMNGGEPVRQEMNPDLSGQSAGASGGCVYCTAVSAARSPTDYTARVIPHCDGVSVPLENGRILWQR